MREILRNMWRRKVRSLLTIFGISVGIFAFTVMGSMALRFNKMIAGGKSYITGQITVLPKGSNFMAGSSGVLPLDTLKRMAQVEGVEAVAAGVELALSDPDPDNPTGSGASFGPPPTIEGIDVDSNFVNRNWQTLDMKSGRMLEQGDPENAIAIGYTIALDNELETGDTFTIRDRDFVVQGVLDQTLTGPDTYVFMNLNQARELYIESNPFLKSLSEQSPDFNIEDVTVAAAVSWKDGQDSEVVVERIKEQFRDEVLVLSPKKLGEQIDQASAVFNAVILGSAVIALIVGGFSIINTMVMAVSERKKEIGIKKALGASNRTIAREYTLEAGVIGFIGGLVGLGLGILAIVIINSKTAASGAEIFLLDPWFLAGVVLFAFILGTLSGLAPASRASRLKAVDAIREL